MDLSYREHALSAKRVPCKPAFNLRHPDSQGYDAICFAVSARRAYVRTSLHGDETARLFGFRSYVNALSASAAPSACPVLRRRQAN
jgi:hypothetical protein